MGMEESKSKGDFSLLSAKRIKAKYKQRPKVSISLLDEITLGQNLSLKLNFLSNIAILWKLKENYLDVPKIVKNIWNFAPNSNIY